MNIQAPRKENEEQEEEWKGKKEEQGQEDEEEQEVKLDLTEEKSTRSPAFPFLLSLFVYLALLSFFHSPFLLLFLSFHRIE